MSEHQRLLDEVKKAHDEMERTEAEYALQPNDLTDAKMRLARQQFYKAEKALHEYSQGRVRARMG